MLAGMRVSTVRSIIVAIITEMLGAYGGLGWVIFQAVLQIDFVQVWAAIFVASAASLEFFGLISFARTQDHLLEVHAMKRQMHLGLFILGTGSHVAGWRYPGAMDSFQDIATIQRDRAAPPSAAGST